MIICMVRTNVFYPDPDPAAPWGRPVPIPIVRPVGAHDRIGREGSGQSEGFHLCFENSSPTPYIRVLLVLPACFRTQVKVVENRNAVVQALRSRTSVYPGSFHGQSTGPFLVEARQIFPYFPQFLLHSLSVTQWFCSAKWVCTFSGVCGAPNPSIGTSSSGCYIGARGSCHRNIWVKVSQFFPLAFPFFFDPTSLPFLYARSACTTLLRSSVQCP